MGAYSPVPGVDDGLVDRLVEQAVAPLVEALVRRGIDYRGVLYAGLMLTPDGPKVLEFNVRFGDPETQVVLPRLDGDLAALLAEAAAGSLVTRPRFAPGAAVCVVMASEGYPESPRTGDPIDGLDVAGEVEGVTVFHAGTSFASTASAGTASAGTASAGGVTHDGVVTSGGRVLGVTGLGPSLEEARARAYRGVAAISWPGAHVRSDIAREAAASPTGLDDLVASAAHEGAP